MKGWTNVRVTIYLKNISVHTAPQEFLKHETEKLISKYNNSYYTNPINVPQGSAWDLNTDQVNNCITMKVGIMYDESVVRPLVDTLALMYDPQFSPDLTDMTGFSPNVGNLFESVTSLPSGVSPYYGDYDYSLTASLCSHDWRRNRTDEEGTYDWCAKCGEKNYKEKRTIYK